MTLIEVVAGLALMGTLLAFLLIGSSRQLRQYRDIRLRQLAMRTVDDFLNNWSQFNFSQASQAECSATAIAKQVAKNGESKSMQLRIGARPIALESGMQLELVRVEALTTNSQGTQRVITWVEIVRRSSGQL